MWRSLPHAAGHQLLWARSLAAPRPARCRGCILDNRLSLRVNTVLDGSYRIVRVVGAGGFAITNEAEDIHLGTPVALKEYYPVDFGDRDGNMNVRPKSERHRNTFDWGRSNFLQEARTLARFEHPSIVRVTPRVRDERDRLHGHAVRGGRQL